MTTSHPDALPAISGEMILGEDTAGCVCVVASYVAVASLVSAATEDAGRRVMMSPALGDFVELTFVSIGPEPGQSGDRSAAVRRLTKSVLESDSQAGRSYFAVVVADPSAAEVERVLIECANSPFLAQLPIHLHGIAAREDRSNARNIVGSRQVAVADPGGWGQEYLVGELRRYADGLMRYFAAGQEGLSRSALDSIRARYEDYAVREHGEESPVPSVAAAAETPALPTSSGVSGPVVVSPSPAAGPLIPGPPSSAAQPSPPADVQLRRPDSLAQAVPGVPAYAPAVQAEIQQLPAARPRLGRLLNPRWHRARPPEPAAADQAVAPRVSALAYLLVVGDEIADDPAAWQRSRTALLTVDEKIASLRQATYSVRLLQGNELALRGETRPAGQLSRRDVKAPVSDADFAGVLAELRTITRRDFAHSTKPAARPAVIFFVSEPPLADSVTAEAFCELAGQATVIWVIPKELMDLMSSVFTNCDGVHVVEDGDSATDDIADVLNANTIAADTVESSAADDARA